MLTRKLISAILLLATSVFGGQVSFSPGGQQGLIAPPSKTPEDQLCSLQGQVTNSITGEPVKKATINLQLLTGQQQGYSTTSGADGAFSFTAVEPGNYNLYGIRQGYLLTQYGKEKQFRPQRDSVAKARG